MKTNVHNIFIDGKLVATTESSLTRYHVLRDSAVVASCTTREEAFEKIQLLRSRETHWLKSEYYIIKGEEEYIREEY